MKHTLAMTITILGLLISFTVALDASEAQTPLQAAAGQGSTAIQAPAQASPSSSVPTSKTEKAGEVLFVFLVLSVVFEVALTPIFNWRVFLKHFEGKGVKTPVTVALAFIVFWGYGLDVVKDLLVALGYSANKTLGGQFLTALLIAGGSDGVLRIFTKLGIRNPAERKQKAEEARQS